MKKNEYIHSYLHKDFNNIGTETFNNPTYVPSPYGAWLAISSTPSADSFSDWFRKINTNYEYKRSVILEGLTTSIPTNRFFSSAFFPIDGLGFGDQNQRDCDTNRHNFG